MSYDRRQHLALLKHLCGKSYYKFFLEFWHCIESETLTDNWHVEHLCNELQQIAERVARREPMSHNLIINISPGETKSTLATVMFPVWCWLLDPSMRIITASYSKELALYHSLKSRDLIKSDLFQAVFGQMFELRKDMDAKSNYGNTEKGQRITASVGSTITGKHAHIIIIDDPMNPQQAKSDVERGNINSWLTSTLSSRKVSEELTPTILVMQRLHEDDPTARLSEAWQRGSKLKWLRLPADDRYKIQPEELEKYYTQDVNLRVMNPHRKPASVIREKEQSHTAEDFSGQYGQDPQPAEGNKLKKEWFTQIRTISQLQEIEQHTREPFIWNAVLDGAYTRQKKNSATACLIYAIHRQKLYIRAVREWWLEFPQLIDKLPDFLSGNGFSRQSLLFVEPKAIGKSLVQVLRSRGGINVVEDKLPEGTTTMQGKEMRVDRSTPYLRGMNMYLVKGEDWEPFIKQCTTFPNSTHSDMVDCLTMAVEKVDISSPLSNPDAWVM